MAIPRKLSMNMRIIANFSAMMFVGCLFFTAYEEGRLEVLATFWGLLFLILGTLVAGLLIGAPINNLHRRYAHSLLEKDNGKESESTIKKVRFTGTIVMLVQILAVYYPTAYLFRLWFS